mgnify:CR=1 FL=1
MKAFLPSSLSGHQEVSSDDQLIYSQGNIGVIAISTRPGGTDLSLRYLLVILSLYRQADAEYRWLQCRLRLELGLQTRAIT